MNFWLRPDRVSKNVPPLACYNFDAHEWILIFFGRNVTDKIGNQKTLYYATSNNLCFCTTWQNAKTRRSHISLNNGLCYTHNAPVRCLPESSPFPQIDIIGAVVIVWRVRGKIIRSVLCSIVCNNCAQCDAHTYEQN